MLTLHLLNIFIEACMGKCRIPGMTLVRVYNVASGMELRRTETEK